MKQRAAFAAMISAGVLSATLFAQAPDNTKQNQRDKRPGATTADQQGNSKADVDLTAKIRKAITDRNDISTYGKNVKIITVNGDVTLRGPVKDMGEKRMISKLAGDIAGGSHVNDQLEITPKQ